MAYAVKYLNRSTLNPAAKVFQPRAAAATATGTFQAAVPGAVFNAQEANTPIWPDQAKQMLCDEPQSGNTPAFQVAPPPPIIWVPIAAATAALNGHVLHVYPLAVDGCHQPQLPVLPHQLAAPQLMHPVSDVCQLPHLPQPMPLVTFQQLSNLPQMPQVLPQLPQMPQLPQQPLNLPQQSSQLSQQSPQQLPQQQQPAQFFVQMLPHQQQQLPHQQQLQQQQQQQLLPLPLPLINPQTQTAAMPPQQCAAASGNAASGNAKPTSTQNNRGKQTNTKQKRRQQQQQQQQQQRPVLPPRCIFQVQQQLNNERGQRAPLTTAPYVQWHQIIMSAMLHMMLDEGQPISYAFIVGQLAMRLSCPEDLMKRLVPNVMFEASNKGYVRRVNGQFVLGINPLTGEPKTD
ncbi:hypothetical protein ACLKA7_005757 [Drosophila subpalustris]